MRKLSSFLMITLDGYYADAQGDMGWAHKSDPEWTAFGVENAKGGGVLLFGRVTYDLMNAYWPTPLARENNPAVAERMNSAPKIVFSKTMTRATWANTQLVGSDIAGAVRKMKDEPGPDMAILGSGIIITQLAEERLIDAFQFVVNPLALGQGKRLFDGIRERLALKLTGTRSFANGNVLLNYEAA